MDRKDNAAGELLQQVNVGGIDAYGNVTQQTIHNGSQAITTTIAYGSQGQYAFPTQQSMQVTDADQAVSTVSLEAEY